MGGRAVSATGQRHCRARPRNRLPRLSHRLVYEQITEEFYEETLRAKTLLEDITGSAVIGYRAASYSIVRRSLWALDILVELGFVYDSSIFPVHHDRYGIPNSERVPYRISTPNGKSIVEWPLATAEIFGCRLPVAGGGYFRLFPILVLALGIGINQPSRPATVRLLPAPVGNRSIATARVRELVIAVSSLYEPRKVRGAVAALAWRVRVRYCKRQSCAARLAFRLRDPDRDRGSELVRAIAFPEAEPSR